jgi:hypothetical protein
MMMLKLHGLVKTEGAVAVACSDLLAACCWELVSPLVIRIAFFVRFCDQTIKMPKACALSEVTELINFDLVFIQLQEKFRQHGL